MVTPVELSLITKGPAVPIVNRVVALVSLITVGLLIEAPDPPEILKSVEGVSWVQTVFVPVSVNVVVLPLIPFVGEIDKEGDSIVILVVLVLSLIASDPVAFPVVKTRVAVLVLVIF